MFASHADVAKEAVRAYFKQKGTLAHVRGRGGEREKTEQRRSKTLVDQSCYRTFSHRHLNILETHRSLSLSTSLPHSFSLSLSLISKLYGMDVAFFTVSLSCFLRQTPPLTEFGHRCLLHDLPFARIKIVENINFESSSSSLGNGDGHYQSGGH